MNQFTTILWDVDGTLLDFHYSQRRAMEACFQKYIGKNITEEQLSRYSAINDMFWKKLELGEVTKAQLLPGRFIQLFSEYGIEGVDVEAFQKQYQVELGLHFSVIDDAVTICKSLQGIVKQYVITNGVTIAQQTKLRLSGLAEVMEELFISEAVGAPKPHQAYFDYVLEHVEEKDKTKMLIVGDSLSSDIKGGVLNGIPTCWYRPQGTANTSEYIPDYEISDLHEIYNLLGVFLNA